MSQIEPSAALSAMNAGLSDAVAQLRAKDPVGVVVSNAGGWQSPTGNTENFDAAEAGSFLRTQLVSYCLRPPYQFNQ